MDKVKDDERLSSDEAEKFITLIKQDKFDYTQWRKNLWEDKSLEEICVKGDEVSKKLRKSTANGR
ncbi:MAG: hypothetical protein HW390_917 [Candidatus Brocadiaceae bacterium]|nr:hypothetical protein [Candidatus Brocadiaceae bacterium]